MTTHYVKYVFCFHLLDPKKPNTPDSFHLKVAAPILVSRRPPFADTPPTTSHWWFFQLFISSLMLCQATEGCLTLPFCV